MGFNLADLLESVAAAVGDREALVCPAADGDPEVRLTYRQLDERATRLAHVLAGVGVGRDDAVGLMLRNGNEYLEAMLACFKLRAVPVNVSYRAVAPEAGSLLADCAAAAILHEPELANVVAASGHLAPTLARGAAWEEALAAASARPVAPGGRSGDDRYVLYTGGTTGRPKGVVWRHEDLFFGALGGGRPGGEPVTDPAQVAVAAITGRSRCLPASPFVHGTGHWSALTTLLSGGTVVALRDARFDAGKLLDVVAAESVTFLVVVGDAFGRPIVDALADRGDVERLSSLNVILSGGATLSPSTKADLLALLPWVVVVDGFGASETGGQGQRVSYPGAAVAPGHGRFTMGPETTVLDDDLRPLALGDGRVGWLARRGHIPLGYLGDPEGTASTFPVLDGVRWAVPGDRAAIARDGTIVVHGRGSSTINTGGEKVHAEEVEAVVRAHPAVLDAVVVGVADDRWGEIVAAVVSVRPGESLTVQEVAEHCRPDLAGYKLPRRLVVVDEVVRSAAGKPDIRWARAAATASDKTPSEGVAGTLAP